MELSTESDFVDHFLGKVSLNMLVIRWLRGENRHMTTNQELRQQAIDMAVKVRTGAMRNTLVYRSMTDARNAVKLIMDAGYTVSWVGGNQPALNVTFDVEHPPVTADESVDGNEWRWDDRPYPHGQCYRVPNTDYPDVIALSREAILK